MGAGLGWAAGALACAFAWALVGAAPAAAAPRAVITSGPADPTPDSVATFTFAASEPAILTSFECRLDAAAWVPCSSPWRVDGLGGGRHRFEVRLVGPLADPTPAGRDWTVELQMVATPGVPSGALNPAPVAPLPGDGGCPDGDARPGLVPSGALARAVLCLLDHERRLRGLQPLRLSAPLTLAARRHARDMVRRRYFAHVSPAGDTLGDRAARTGYLRGASGWSLGEVLAWTDRARATPRSAVRALMRSAPHRRIILTAAYRDVGIAVIGHAPLAGVRRGATFVADFGRTG
jgi:uncharacterized protein YkwD